MSNREARHLTHGMSKTRIYKIWVDMKRRCNNKNRKGYKYYGGRGITYCPEWENFEPFYKWALSNGYAEKLTLDRIDVNGNYEPNNCRWVDYTTQANNTNRNHILTYKGKTQTLSEWAREYDIPYGILQDRINDLNWNIEDALTIPISSTYRNHKMLTFKGKSQNISQWSKELGVSRRTISDRLKKGLPIEQVLSKEHIKRGRMITFKGETHNITEWSNILDIKPQILIDRLGKLGWSVEKTLSTPYLERKETNNG